MGSLASVYVRVLPDTKGFARELTADLARVNARDIGVKVAPDTAGFARKLQASLAREGGDVQVKADLDPNGLSAKVHALAKHADSTTHIKVEADTKHADKGFRDLGGAIRAAINPTKLFAGTMSMIKFPAIIAGANAAAGAVAALGVGALGAVSSLAPLAGLLPAAGVAASAFAQAQGTVTLATHGLGDAFNAFGEDAKKYAKAYAALTPAQKQFMDTIKPLKMQLIELRNVAAKNLFPGVEAGLKSMAPLFKMLGPIIAATASTLGGLASRAGQLMGSGPFRADFKTITSANVDIIKTLGDAGIMLGGSFMTILAAAAPLTKHLSVLFAQGVAGIANWVEAARASGKLSEFFTKTEIVVRSLGSTIGHFFHALGPIFGQGAKAGAGFLDMINRGAKAFDGWTHSAKGAASIKRVFDDAKPVLAAIGRLISSIVHNFAGFGKGSGGKNLAHLIDIVSTKAVPAFAALVKNTGGKFLENLTSLSTNLLSIFSVIGGNSGTLTAFVGAMATLAGVLAAVFKVCPPLGTAMSGLLAALAIGKMLGLTTMVSAFIRFRQMGSLKALFMGNAAGINAEALAVERLNLAQAGGAAAGAKGAAGGAAAGAAGKGAAAGAAARAGAIALAGAAAIAAGASAAGKWLDGYNKRFAAGAKDGKHKTAWQQFVGDMGRTGAAALSFDLTKAGNALDAALKVVGGWMVHEIAKGFAAVGGVLERAALTVWHGVQTAVGPAFHAIGGAVSTGWGYVRGAFSSGGTGVKGVWNGLWNGLKGVASAIWGPIRSAASTGWALVRGALAAAGGGVKTAWNGLWNGLKSVASAIWNPIKNAVTVGWGKVTGAFAAAYGGIKAKFSRFWNDLKADKGIQAMWRFVSGAVARGWGIVRGAFTWAIGVVKGVWSGFWHGLTAVASSIWGAVRGAVARGWNSVKGVFTSAIGVVKGVWSGFWHGLSGVASSVWGAVRGAVSKGWNSIKGAFSSGAGGSSHIWSGFWHGLTGVASSIWHGIQGAVSRGMSAISGIISRVGGVIGRAFSHVWSGFTGIASRIWAPIHGVISRGVGAIGGIISRVGGAVAGAFRGIWSGFSGVVQGAWKNITGIITGALHAVEGAITRWVGWIGGMIGKIPGMIGGIISHIPGGNAVKHLLGMAEGGHVVGPGTGTSDSILARLSAGEFVVNAKATAANTRLLEALNSGNSFAVAPPVKAMQQPTDQRYAAGGPVQGQSQGGYAPTVRVFIGDRELTDMVRVEVDKQNDTLTSALHYGRRR